MIENCVNVIKKNEIGDHRSFNTIGTAGTLIDTFFSIPAVNIHMLTKLSVGILRDRYEINCTRYIYLFRAKHQI